MTARLNQLKAAGWLRETNFIDGQWVAATAGERLPVDDPATAQTIGHIAWSGTHEAELAIDAAHAAFGAWSMTTAAERADLLQAMARTIRDNLDDLAGLLTLEQGKPLAEARAEIKLGADYVQWFAEEARRINGEIIPSPWKGRQIQVTREPVGVVGAISPWNFPFSMLSRKIAPALAAGCTVVVKPSEFTPYCGLLWGVLAEKAGIPKGVINVVTGDAIAIGNALSGDPRVRKLTFTGSTRVGKLLYAQSAATMKKLSLELGGNAPFIVFDDADIDQAVEGAIASKFRNSGQTCVCTNRFYVQDAVYDTFAQRLAERVRTLRVGNGFDADVQQGPLINQAAVDKVQSHVADARSKGGRVLTGGEPHVLGGTFYPPTVIVDATEDMLIAHEETFGPVAALFRFTDEQDAIDAANSTEFGLAAYFYSTNLSRVFRVSRALDSGMVGINEGIVTTEVAPFGGVKDSGIGREGSTHGIDEYLSLKYVSLGGL
ncbi:succinate-semialdehyde dehydrogenase / glutarate-semialdehyde dehydrogenase [Pseudoxanthomonas sp. GM95]|uniref:NAD-dependent succinate-semialdehyde dehydrogenase n=1 Tax=Pseudoxanthomonas sp. GM95 TaxID=1881043 RepID=UPI0008D7613A|nr:NAD-dependent succinate-semialdehyde dehydrogenase [Pseudoxanthomonas sp. GM95]SEM59207.1 succinate-semialdehyde dehydrogenase / glutarate-semialdehyde dehydrogenase [Pseudoxanthomonas sp. GM95]